MPHFHVDSPFASVMKVLETFLLASNASDIVLVVQDDQMEDEVLSYNLKSASSALRFLVLSPSSIASIAQRLHSIRPVPDLFAIIAESDRMKGIFRDVSLISQKFWERAKAGSEMDEWENWDKKKKENPNFLLIFFS